MAIVTKSHWKESVKVDRKSTTEIQNADHVDDLCILIGLCMQYKISALTTI